MLQSERIHVSHGCDTGMCRADVVRILEQLVTASAEITPFVSYLLLRLSVFIYFLPPI